MPPERRTTIVIPARPEALEQGTAFVADWVRAAGMTSQRIVEIEIAAEEVLVNICRYAYVDGPGTIEIRCLHEAAQTLCFEFIDTGRPFNLLQLPIPDLLADVGDRPVGGLGVLLIRSMVDTVTYCREGARNVLRLGIQVLP